MTCQPVRICTHIRVTGHRCGSPALRGQFFCYFHARLIKGVRTRVDSQIDPIAIFDDAESIQVGIMQLFHKLLHEQIDYKRAVLLLRALHIASKNARRVRFDLQRSTMVREVPDYAAQYLHEHPELGPPLAAREIHSNSSAKPTPLPLPAIAPTPRQTPIPKKPPAKAARRTPAQQRKDLERLEISLERARRGSLEDVKHVFREIGLFPAKEGVQNA